MNNQLKDFFDTSEYEQHFATDGPSFSFLSVAVGVVATMVAMFIIFTNLKG